jgi:LCP family protein required for cell wall assembly
MSAGMKKTKPKWQPKEFDIHRTLPDKGKLESLQKHPEILEDFKGFRWKRLFVWLFLLVFGFFLFIASWDAYELSKASQKMFGTGNLVSLLAGGDLNQTSGRTNILVAGYSADDPGHSGANLTDSIMILSLNNTTKSGYMLSVPRDLYVKIPGFGYAKINEAYEDGQSANFQESGYAAGGMGLLEKVISENFNLPLHYYALINYAAFRDTVNALGGITVNINSPDPRGLYDPNISSADGGPLLLNNGPQTLDGQTALNLARARGDPCGCGKIAYGFNQGDFDRTQHQREMLLAVKQKAISLKNIINPTKAGHIFDGMANNVKTDVDVSEVLPLYRLFDAINNTNLKSYGLRDINGKNLLASYTTPYGQSALIPAAGINNYSQIQDAISLF